MAKNATGSVIDDWTAVSANAIVHSGEVDVSPNFEQVFHLQACCTSITGHDGTRFVIQTSSASSGDEDWTTRQSFIGLAGGSATSTITTQAEPTDTTIADTGEEWVDADEGTYLLIANATIANSEIIMLTAVGNPYSILDGLTNQHIVTTPVYSNALSISIQLKGVAILRARIVVDNNYDATPSAIQYKLSLVKSTSLS